MFTVSPPYVEPYKPRYFLLVTDRATGHTERIGEYDGNFAESILHAAECNGITLTEAMHRLRAGEELATAGCLRRLVKEE